MAALAGIDDEHARFLRLAPLRLDRRISLRLIEGERSFEVWKPEQLKEIARECPGFQARATARAITRFFNTYFRSLDVTSEQFSLLIGIEASTGITVAELAAQSGVDTTTLSRNVQVLEKRKLVRGTGRGRAGKQLQLTATGRSLLENAVPLWRQARAELATVLGESGLRSANRAMRAVADAVRVGK